MTPTEWIFLLMATSGITWILLRQRYRAARVCAWKTSDYIQMMVKVTGKSEYEVFCKSAESWQINEGQIKTDYKTFQQKSIIPFYVSDFVRKNKHHLDALKNSV